MWQRRALAKEDRVSPTNESRPQSQKIDAVETGGRFLQAASRQRAPEYLKACLAAVPDVPPDHADENPDRLRQS